MKLYIPELGDEIVLTKDWTFDLHSENRNETLAVMNGFYTYYNSNYQTLFINESEIPQIRDQDYVVEYPNILGFEPFRDVLGKNNGNWQKYNDARTKAEQDTPGYIKYWDDYNEWRRQCDTTGTPTIRITIPKGSVLKIDRIYIRKGAKDFSSVTFYWKNVPSVKTKQPFWSSMKHRKSAVRFWTKLADVNNITCEKM